MSDSLPPPVEPPSAVQIAAALDQTKGVRLDAGRIAYRHRATAPLDLVGALVAALVVMLVMVVLSWPLVIFPEQLALGGTDFASIAWGLHRVAEAMPALPALHTDSVFFPRGGTLLIADLPEAVLLSPISKWFGAVAATNLLQLAHPALAAGLAFLFARDLGQSRPGAAVAAVSLGLAPVMLAGLHNGNPDTTPLYFLPLVGLLAARAHRGIGWGVGAGALVGTAAMVNPYVGVMAALVGGAFAVGQSWVEWVRVGLGGLTAMGLMVVSVLVTRASLAVPDALVVKSAEGAGGVGWIAGFGWPWYGGGVDGQTVHAWYLGFSVLLLALAALAGAGKGPRWRLLGLLVVAVLLAQGTSLHIGPMPLLVAGHELLLPWSRLPGMDSLHLTWRFGGLAIFAAGLLAGGAAGLLGRLGWGAAVVVALDLLVIGRGAGMVQVYDVRDDGACAILAELPAGPVIDLPEDRGERWMLAQTCHGRKVAQGINRPFPGQARRALASEDPVHALGSLGYRYLVLHPGAPEGLAERLAARVVARRDGVVVVDVGALR